MIIEFLSMTLLIKSHFVIPAKAGMTKWNEISEMID